MISDVQLPIANYPEMISKTNPLYQDFLDIHHDLLMLADAMFNAGASGGLDDIPPDVEPDDWSVWPMSFLHKINIVYGEDINAGQCLKIGLTDGKAYLYAYRDDKAFPVPAFPAAPYTQRLGSDCFALALETGKAGNTRQVMLYGAMNIPDLWIQPIYPSSPTLTEFSLFSGASPRINLIDPIISEAGRTVTGRTSPLNRTAAQGGAWYVGGEAIIFSGGKWYPDLLNN